jgi:hypothetical protein
MLRHNELRRSDVPLHMCRLLYVTLLVSCASTRISGPPIAAHAVIASLRYNGHISLLDNDYHFVLYEDGTYIVRRMTEDHFVTYVSAKFDPGETANFLTSLDAAAFSQLQPSYSLPPISDASVVIISVFDLATHTNHEVEIHGFRSQDTAPKPFVHAYDVLSSSFGRPNEQHWFPQYVNITVRKSGVTQPACVWPTQWETMSPTHGAGPFAVNDVLGTIKLPGSNLLELQGLLRKCESTFALDGQSVNLFLEVRLPHQI